MVTGKPEIRHITALYQVTNSDRSNIILLNHLKISIEKYFTIILSSGQKIIIS